MADYYRVVKPDLPTAMARLIQQIRQAVPFDMPTEKLCDGACRGCAKKLLAFLDAELEEWERRLADDETPTFGDLNRLARRSLKVRTALQRNNLM